MIAFMYFYIFCYIYALCPATAPPAPAPSPRTVVAAGSDDTSSWTASPSSCVKFDTELTMLMQKQGKPARTTSKRPTRKDATSPWKPARTSTTPRPTTPRTTIAKACAAGADRGGELPQALLHRAAMTGQNMISASPANFRPQLETDLVGRLQQQFRCQLRQALMLGMTLSGMPAVVLGKPSTTPQPHPDFVRTVAGTQICILEDMLSQCVLASKRRTPWVSRETHLLCRTPELGQLVAWPSNSGQMRILLSLMLTTRTYCRRPRRWMKMPARTQPKESPAESRIS